MGFVTSLIVSLVVMVVGELLRPKQNPQNATASSLDDFDVPTAEEGRAIPVFFGTVRISGANVVWYGDLESAPIKKKVKTGLWSSKKQTIGYKYFLGMQMALCHGRDDITLVKMTVDGETPHGATFDDGDGSVRIEFNDEEFFGGKESGGGFVGTMRFYKGNVGQLPNEYMAGQVGEVFPAYEGLCHAVFEHTYMGTSPYIKNIAWIVSSFPNQLGMQNGRHRIGDDCNPVCMIYEIITNEVWGCGVPGANVDVAGLRAVGDVLFAEGFGISSLYNGGSSAKDVISDILRHIDGVLFTDPETGLVNVKLARADYDEAALPVYDESVFLEGIKFSRPSWSETKNHVKGTWVDRENDFAQAVLSQADLANVTQRGGEMEVEQVDYSGFNTYSAASRAVARTLKTLSYPLAKVTGTINLTKSSYGRPKPNDVFKLRWGPMGINEVVYRIMSVGYEDITQNRYTIEATEDIFAISHVPYIDPGPSEWVKPSLPAGNLLNQHILEAPYFFTEDERSYIMTMGSRSNKVDYGYKCFTAPSGQDLVKTATVTDWTSTAELLMQFPIGNGVGSDAGFAVKFTKGPDEIDTVLNPNDQRAGATLALIISGTTEEFVAYLNADVQNGLYTDVWRGLLDTVPQSHPEGSLVYFLGTGFGFANESPFTSPQAIDVGLVPYSGWKPGAPTIQILTIDLDMRASRPLPPGNVKIAGINPYASKPAVNGAGFTVSWAPRTRGDEVLVRQDEGDRNLQSIEVSNLKYKLRFTAVLTGQVLLESQEISSGTHSAAITLAYSGDVKVEVWTTMLGRDSHQRHSFIIGVTAGATTGITPDDPVLVIDAGEVKP